MKCSDSVERRSICSTEQLIRVLLWGFGLALSERNRGLISGCIPLFQLVALNDNDVVLRKNVNRHVWFVVSGDCRARIGDSSMDFHTGEWIKTEYFPSPNHITVRVTSNTATFLRIPERDFKDKLPLILTQRMDRRIRGIASHHLWGYGKALRISHSIVPEIKDTLGAPKSARLLPIREINRFVDGTNVHADCEQERLKLQKLNLTAR